MFILTTAPQAGYDPGHRNHQRTLTKPTHLGPRTESVAPVAQTNSILADAAAHASLPIPNNVNQRSQIPTKMP
jgi:hypothetical protein